MSRRTQHSSPGLSPNRVRYQPSQQLPRIDATLQKQQGHIFGLSPNRSPTTSPVKWLGHLSTSLPVSPAFSSAGDAESLQGEVGGSYIEMPSRRTKAKEAPVEDAAMIAPKLRAEGVKLAAFLKQRKAALIAKSLESDDIPDITAEESMYSEVLSRLSSAIAKVLPTHSEVLNEVLEWYVETPVDRLMQARKDSWRRPHHEAFEMLETEVYNSAKLAETSQQAERRARTDNKELQREVEALREQIQASLTTITDLQNALTNQQKGSANHAQEARVLRELSGSQGIRLVEIRQQLEKALKDLIKEQKAKQTVVSQAEILKDTIKGLEGEIIKLRPPTPNRDGARKYRRRNKDIMDSIKAVMDEQRRAHRMQEEQKAKTAQLIAQIEVDQAGAYRDQSQALFALEAAAHSLKDFSELAAASEKDRTVSMAKVGELIDFLKDADPFSDSDSDDGVEHVEEENEDDRIQDPALLRIKCKGLDKSLELMSSEFAVKQGEVDTYRRELIGIQDIKQKLEEKTEKIKEELDRTKAEARKKEGDLRKKMDDVNLKNSEISATLSVKVNEIGQLTKDKKTLEAKVSILELEVNALKSDWAGMQGRIHDLEGEVQAAAKKEDELVKAKADIETQLSQVGGQISQANNAKNAALDELKSANQRVRDMEREHAEALSETKRMKKEEDALQKELRMYKSSAENGSSAQKQAEERLSQALAKISHLEADAAKLNSQLSAMGEKGAVNHNPVKGKDMSKAGAPKMADLDDSHAKSKAPSPQKKPNVEQDERHESELEVRQSGSIKVPDVEPAHEAEIAVEITIKNPRNVYEYVRGNTFAVAVGRTMNMSRFTDILGTFTAEDMPDIDDIMDADIFEKAQDGDEEALMLMCMHEEFLRLTEIENQSKAREQSVVLDGQGFLAQPPSTVAQPPSTVAQPPSTVAQPPSTVAQPPSIVAQPSSTVAQPPSTVAQPPSTVAQPPSIVAQPPSTVAQPPSTVAQPPSTVAQPPSTVAQPPSTVAQPPSTVAQLPSTVAQPPSTVAQPPSTVAQPPSTVALSCSGQPTKMRIMSSIGNHVLALKFSNSVKSYEGGVLDDSPLDINGIVNEGLITEANNGNHEAMLILKLRDDFLRLNEEVDASAEKQGTPANKSRFAAHAGSVMAGQRFSKVFDRKKMLESMPPVGEVLNEKLLEKAAQGDKKAMLLVRLVVEVETMSSALTEPSEENSKSAKESTNSSMPLSNSSMPPSTSRRKSSLYVAVKREIVARRFAKALSCEKVAITKEMPRVEDIITEEVIAKAKAGDKKSLMLVTLHLQIMRMHKQAQSQVPTFLSIKKEANSQDAEMSVKSKPSMTDAGKMRSIEAGSLRQPSRKPPPKGTASETKLEARSGHTQFEWSDDDADGDNAEQLVDGSSKVDGTGHAPPRSAVVRTTVSTVNDSRLVRMQQHVLSLKDRNAQRMILLGPWSSTSPSTVASPGPAENGVGELLLTTHHLAELARQDLGNSRSISERILRFRAAANARFQSLAQDAMRTELAPASLAKALVSHGLNRDEARDALTMAPRTDSGMVDAEGFVNGLLQSQAIRLFRQMDQNGSQRVNNTTAVDMLQALGYSAADSEEFVSRADVDKTGGFDEYHWVESYRKYLTPFKGSLPRSVPKIFSVAVAGAAPARVQKSLRDAGHSVYAAPMISQPAQDPADTITQRPSAEVDKKAQAVLIPEMVDNNSWSLSGNVIKPTPFGKMFEEKDVLISRLEKERNQLQSEIQSLWTFVKESINQHNIRRTQLKEQIDQAMADTITMSFKDYSDVSTSTGPGDFEAASVHSGSAVQQGGVLLVAQVKSAPQAKRGSIRCKESLLKLADMLEHRESLSSRKPRTLVWLIKTIHALLDDKVQSDSVELAHGNRPVQFSEFVASYFKKNFGLEQLVRKKMWDFHNSLEGMSSSSSLVRLVQGMCNASYTSGQQSSFMQAWALLATVNGNGGKDTLTPQNISLQKALEFTLQVLPYASTDQRSRVNKKLDAASCAGMIDEYSFLECVMDERAAIQKDFMSAMNHRFMELDRNREGVLEYPAISKLLMSIVPWILETRLHTVITEACPDFLMPGAAIDALNLAALDDVVDFMGRHVTSPTDAMPGEGVERAMAADED